MKLRVASIGQRMPAWVEQGWAEYARRMPAELALELREIPLQKRPKNPDLERLKRREGEALLQAVSPGFRVIALDGRGRPWTSIELARRLEHWMADGRHCGFLIGGPDGLDRACLDAADETWSLGPMTLPHALVRVIIAEALYRAWTITCNHPYHRA